MELLKKIWHLVPYNIRTKMLVGSHLKRNNTESKEKIELIDKENKDACEEIRNSIDYMISHNRIAAFNAEWTEKYLKMPIKIKRDNGWPYYEYYGKRMYLKKNWSNDKACSYVKNILMEQDASSPHRYFEENEVLENEVVFDCGGAEGNFVLEIIDKIDKAVIFECDQEWVEALKKPLNHLRKKCSL